MQRLAAFRITRGMAIRVLADALMVNIALAAALSLRFLLVLGWPGDTKYDYQNEFWVFVQSFVQNCVPLTLILLGVCALSGFYTYGKAYHGRFKGLIIATAVGQAYLIYGCLTYLFWNGMGLAHIPRGALVLAAFLNLGLKLASRTWTFVWERVVRPEKEQSIRQKGETVRSVLVIGGAGYIGSALLPKLLRQGYRVRVLDMFIYGTEPIADVADHSNIELMTGDFRQVDMVVRAMQGMDAVTHLGAIVGDPACDIDEDVTVAVNLSATQMIAQVAKASGIRRFIFASTCSVYGACDDLLDERSEVQPISLYGHTKLAAERGLQSMADESFTPTIVRFATIYGLSGRTRFDLVINLLSAKAKVDGQITVHGGRQWRPFVHVDDAALGVFQLLKAPMHLVANEVFNVGSDDQNHTIEEVGKMIHEKVIGSELILDENTTDQRNYRVSFRKIHNKIGFEPQWSVNKGIDQVVDAVTDGQVSDYQDAQYSNVKYLKERGGMQEIRVDDDWSQHLNASKSPEFVS